MRKTICLITSDKTDALLFSRMLYLSFLSQGYEVLWQKNADARIAFDALPPCTVVADADVLSQSRQKTLLQSARANAVPCIFYTEKEDADFACDALLQRPFAMETLFACVKDLGTPPSPPVTEKEDTPEANEFHFTPAFVTFRQVPLSLTATERMLLEYLYDRRGQVCTRKELLKAVWGDDGSIQTNLVDVYIRYLRKKIDLAFDLRLIVSVRGQGYCMK